MANGAPTVSNGLVISGVTTSTTFSGSGASLTNLNASNIASGTIPTARLGSGTANSSTFLRGDSTFATVTSTTINNNADNRVITGSGTANTLNGESGLTYDGSQLVIETSAQNNLKIDSSHSDGPNIHFERSGTAFAYLGSAAANTSGTATDLALRAQGNLVFATNGGNERLLITNAGQVRIGNSNNLAAWGQNNRLQVAGTDWNTSGVTIANMAAANIAPNLVFGKSRGSTPGTAISNGDRLGYISFTGDDGTDLHTVGAAIVAGTDAAPSSNSIPGTLQFYTGGNDNVRLSINSSGQVTKPNQPLFVVQKSAAISGTGTVVFNTVIENVGSHYNSSNGRFTAPIAGYYWFCIKINAYKRIDFFLRRNGANSPNTHREIGQFNTSDQNGWYSHNLIRVFELAANDHVTVDVTNITQNSDPGEWITFQGYLLQ